MSRESTRPGFTLLGAVAGHYGVKGWVRIRSFTRPASDILQYAPWTLLAAKHHGLAVRRQPMEQPGNVEGPWRVLASRQQKNGLVVQLEGIASRDEAEPLIGRQIAVPDGEMPALPQGEYYWTELTGLKVVNRQGDYLGMVDHLLETGANDVLVVLDQSGAESRERLIPWGTDIVDSVDLDAGELRVNWGLDY